MLKTHNNPRIDKLVTITPRISKDLLELEAGLAELKWFDYRMDDPVTATKKFAEEYVKAFKHFHAKYKDIYEVEKKRPLNSTDLTKVSDTDLTSLWKARQSADRLGLPYDTYINAAFRILCGRQYKQFPRPNQVYSDAVLAGIHEMLEGQTVSSVLTVQDERFMSENFRNTPVLKSFQEAIIKRLHGQSESRAAKEGNISIAVFEQQLLPLEIAQEEFDSSLLSEAMAIADSPRKSTQSFSEIDFDSACFGVPHIKSDNATCDACTLKARCIETRSIVENTTESTFGSSDPKGDKKREQARLRKQKQRDRERLDAPIPEGNE